MPNMLNGRNKAVEITPSLHLYEKKVSSQFGEDGVLAKLASDMGLKRGTFFEFGISPAWQSRSPDDLEGNFVQLRRAGWEGTFLDGKALPSGSGVEQAFITPLNINGLWRAFRIPAALDFLSIDVDGQDFWIWMAIAYRPKLVIIEYNGYMPADRSVTVQFDSDHVWDGTIYHGASLLALSKLAASKDYVLVWANGINAIFIQSEIVINKEDFRYDDIYIIGAKGYENVFKQFPPHKADELDRTWVEI